MDDVQGTSAALAPPAEEQGRGAVFGRDLVGQGSWTSLFVWAVLFSGPLAVLITAATLTPAAEGHGTHTQLGLPPCGFLVYTGFPCPGCGLTTSFSHMIRLDVVGAFGANPFGILLFLCTAAMVPLSLLGIVRKMPVVDTLDRLHAEKIAIGLSVVSIVVWMVEVGVQYLAG
ncbi:MAG TPA: DUF2752 domain-containing protein [Sandaracinaceae bacterium LLY-WYZ-13_1]|nr:DUF2752 domain-containing protein [Sandaracinaceae bacterium LLY-WYZ-13_1]